MSRGTKAWAGQGTSIECQRRPEWAATYFLRILEVQLPSVSTDLNIMRSMLILFPSDRCENQVLTEGQWLNYGILLVPGNLRAGSGWGWCERVWKWRMRDNVACVCVCVCVCVCNARGPIPREFPARKERDIHKWYGNQRWFPYSFWGREVWLTGNIHWALIVDQAFPIQSLQQPYDIGLELVFFNRWANRGSWR